MWKIWRGIRKEMTIAKVMEKWTGVKKIRNCFCLEDYCPENNLPLSRRLLIDQGFEEPPFLKKDCWILGKFLIIIDFDNLQKPSYTLFLNRASNPLFILSLPTPTCIHCFLFGCTNFLSLPNNCPSGARKNEHKYFIRGISIRISGGIKAAKKSRKPSPVTSKYYFNIYFSASKAHRFARMHSTLSIHKF